ncbi:ABC transporter ATP-binding protein [Candidatus Poriferisodalis sp.]|uniref:ABC transporter ATP-binding protein n=1 Tax=Candidatus Poriferisodalis sp. TaxID=3101277 RepID=UPI003B02C11F
MSSSTQQRSLWKRRSRRGAAAALNGDSTDADAGSASADAGIAISGLHAGYGGVAVVRDLDLSVRPGEVVALLGPNGAGKTTTLLTVSGLIKPLAGQVRIDGIAVDTKYPHRNARLGVAHVAEDRSLFFDLTTEENLRLGLRESDNESEDLDHALDMLPALRGLLDRRAGLLSGGEQQMLAMARALAGRPRLLLVDEMSLGLAPVIVERLLPLVRDVAESTGAGVLIVEQHIHMALEVVDRAYVMNRGSIVMEGTADELKQHQELLAASYLGGDELDA